MRPFHFKLDIWLFVFFTLHADLASCREVLFHEMSDLYNFCPYTSFCGRNASVTFPGSEGLQSCCQSCSCDPDCALRGDCCFSNKDEYYTGSVSRVTCRSVFVVEPPPQSDIFRVAPYGHRYRMINKCSNDVLACEQLSLNSVETFHPVVSTITGFIYVSALCALCNNETETVLWQPVVKCLPQYESALSDSIDTLINGRVSTNQECYLFYIPPQGFDLAPSPSCNQKVVRTCPAKEGTSFIKYRQFCEMFNATFVLHIGSLVRFYANVYCFLCYNPSNTDGIIDIHYKQCPRFGMVDSEQRLWKQSLTVILDQLSINQKTVTAPYKEHSGCPQNSVIVTTSGSTCRPRKCPWGQILLNGRCGYYSKEWIGGPFVVMLRLTPVKKKEKLIPISFFEDMPDRFKADTQAFWIKRKTLKRWRFYVMYKCNDNKFVDHLVVKATYPLQSLNPQHLKMNIQQTLEDTWLVRHMNKTIAFRVDFNEYNYYEAIHDLDSKNIEIKTSNNFGYYPMWLLCMEGLPLYGNDKVKEFLFPISNFKELFTKDYFITKLFFCDQVDLEPNEYEYQCDSIFFRMKGIRLHVFGLVASQKMTPGLPESTTFSTAMLRNVRICLHEFNQTFSATAVNTNHFITTVSFVYLILY